MEFDIWNAEYQELLGGLNTCLNRIMGYCETILGHLFNHNENIWLNALKVYIRDNMIVKNLALSKVGRLCTLK